MHLIPRKQDSRGLGSLGTRVADAWSRINGCDESLVVSQREYLVLLQYILKIEDGENNKQTN